MAAKTTPKSAQQLAAENEELRMRLDEAEETLRAIRAGEVDALVVSTSEGDHVFTLQGADSIYRALIERMNEGALSLTTDGMILYANQRFASMVKAPLERVIGSAIQSWVVSENQGTVKMLLELGASGTCRAEVHLRTGADTKVPVYLSANALSIEGTTSTLGVVAADLSDRYRSEEALRQSEQKFQAMFDESPLPSIMATYPEGLVVSSNRAFEEALGYTDQQAFGKTSLELGIKPDFAMRTRIIEALKQQGSAHDIEVRAVTRRGEARVFILNLDVVTIGNEQYLLQMAQDITERKQAEEVLRQSERRFSIMFDQAPLPMALSRLPDARYVKVNQAFEQTFGISAQEAAGKTAIDLGISSDVQFRANMLAELHDKGFVHDVEMMTRTRSGDERLFMTSLDILTIGEERFILHMMQDISERRKAEQQISELNRGLERRVRERTAELEAANKELEAFSYSVSHDLRAPLRAIDGLSRIVLDKYAAELPDEGQHYLDLVRQSTHHMGDLLEDLLVLSRLGRQEIRIGQVAPAGIVRQVIDELQPEWEGRQVEFVIGDGETPGDGVLPACSADAGLLRQVYANLLSNAVKFTRGRPVAHIKVGASQTAGECVYYVKDNGLGFDMKYADKLFGVFERLHSEEGYEGTGIGLAIVQRIVHRHGGRIWANAEVDKGATFYFTLGGDENNDPRG